MLLILALSAALPLSHVLANCACGYTVNNTSEPQFALFTDLFETDFLHIDSVGFNDSYDVGWIPQDYNTSAGQDEGPFGMAKQSTNLVANYISNEYDWVGPGVKGPDPGLQLWVRSDMIEPGSQSKPGQASLVPSAEIVSQRDDILYGSFRIAMKTTGVNGTCSAFFVYRNDTQEIDVEILSAQQNSGTMDWPVHMVVQNTTVGTLGDHDGSSQLMYMMASPPGGTVGNYNEYRFDWMPDRVDYYVNGVFAWSETENVPDSPGRVHISHWSNGNPYWSGGPPLTDAVTTVSYVKTYFNSTNSNREAEYRSGCPADASQIRMDTCEIPDQQHAPNPIGQEGNLTGLTFFFTLHNHMEVNQTLYPGFEGTATSFGVYWYSYAVVLFGAMAGLFGYM